jgi:hypothetical protein
MPIVWSILNFGCNLKLNISLRLIFPFKKFIIILASRLAQNNCSSHLCLMNIIVQHAYFFKFIMFANCHVAMSPPLDYNPCTKIWTNSANDQLLFHWSSKWPKPNELSTIMIMGCIEDERCFPNLGFIKNKLRNRMTTHLDLVVKMFD